MTCYVALYTRLSPRPDGSYEGVDVQERAGRRYAARTWPGVPVKVFSDKAISAAAPDAYRPGFEALREAVTAGRVAHVWCVEQTRLERKEAGWFTLAAELDAAGITELHTDRDGIVRVRDDVAGIKAVLAAGEVRRIRQRVNARLDDNAALGRPAGSRPYGYRHGVDEQGHKTLVIVPEQAEVIRESAARVLAGWSLSRIAADLTARGLHGAHRRKVRDASGEVTGDRPTTIGASAVKAMVSNPTVAGVRVHRGREVGPGAWPAILDLDTWHAVRDHLAAPRRVTQADGHTYPVPGPRPAAGRRYLLTGGVARCGVCSAPLTASVKTLKNGKHMPFYLCHPRSGGRACVGIMGDGLEAYVVSSLLDELDKPAFRAAVADDTHAADRAELTAELRGIERDRADLAAEFGAGALTMAEWRAARTGLDARENTVRADLAAVPPPVVGIDLDGLREAWQKMNLDERREVVSLFIESVTVNRAQMKGRKGFDPGRVEIVWRSA